MLPPNCISWAKQAFPQMKSIDAIPIVARDVLFIRILLPYRVFVVAFLVLLKYLSAQISHAEVIIRHLFLLCLEDLNDRLGSINLICHHYLIGHILPILFS